jgi:hypothetical protein
MFMKKLMIPVLAIAALMLAACGDSSSTKSCQTIAYCYKTSDAPDKRKCELDKAFAEQKVKAAEEAGTLTTPLYEDCWEF